MPAPIGVTVSKWSMALKLPFKIPTKMLLRLQVIECLRPRVYAAGDSIIYEGDEGANCISSSWRQRMASLFFSPVFCQHFVGCWRATGDAKKKCGRCCRSWVLLVDRGWSDCGQGPFRETDIRDFSMFCFRSFVWEQHGWQQTVTEATKNHQDQQEQWWCISFTPEQYYNYTKLYSG